MNNNTNSYHIARDKEGFTLYSRVKCCAMCDFCSSRIEHTPTMSMDNEDIAVQVTYCTRHEFNNIKDTSIIQEWCPIVELLDSRDHAAGDNLVEGTFKALFPNS